MATAAAAALSTAVFAAASAALLSTTTLSATTFAAVSEATFSATTFASAATLSAITLSAAAFIAAACAAIHAASQTGSGSGAGADGLSPFWTAFFFSAQTLTTVGYGTVSPVGFSANMIAGGVSIGFECNPFVRLERRCWWTTLSPCHALFPQKFKSRIDGRIR